MEKIGVLLVDARPGILSDIVRNVLEAATSVDLVGDVRDIDDTVDAVASSGCDAVVWMVADARHAVTPAELLRQHPFLRIVAVEGTGEEGSLWLMRPHQAPLGRLSPTRIIAELQHQP